MDDYALPTAEDFVRHWEACRVPECQLCEVLTARLIAAVDGQLDAEEAA